jgi:hypothetical protein
MAISSVEQHGYEGAGHQSGARLAGSTKGHPAPRHRAAKKKVEKGVSLSRGACQKKFISNISHLDKNS